MAVDYVDGGLSKEGLERQAFLLMDVVNSNDTSYDRSFGYN